MARISRFIFIPNSTFPQTHTLAYKGQQAEGCVREGFGLHMHAHTHILSTVQQMRLCVCVCENKYTYTIDGRQTSVHEDNKHTYRIHTHVR